MKARTLALACAACLVLLLTTAVRPTLGAFNRADITNSQNSTRTGQLSATYTVGTNTCTAAPLGTCTSQAIYPGPGNRGAGSVTGTVTNTSNLPGTYSQSVQISECEPLKFDNAINSSAALIARGGIGRQVADKWGTNSAAAFDGDNDSLTGFTPMPIAQMASQSWSMGIWFRAAAGSVGTSLLGGSTNPATVSNPSIGGTPTVRLLTEGRLRVEFVDTTGSLIYYTLPATNLRNGQWHQVILSFERAAGVPSTMRVFVDGAQLQSYNPLEMSPLTGTTLLWHIGWVDASRSPTPDNTAFTGNLSGAFYKPASTSLAQAAALYNSTSAAQYQSLLQGQNVADLWMLGDDANNRYLQPLSYIDGAGDPCGFADYLATYNGSNIMPSTRIADLVTQSAGGTAWSGTVAAPASGSWQFRVWFDRSRATFDVDCLNMEIQVTYSHRVRREPSGWAAVFRWPRMNMII